MQNLARFYSRFWVQSSGHLLIFQDLQERLTVCKSKWFGCWNEICSSRIRPINIALIQSTNLFVVEPDQRKSPTYHSV